MTVSINDKTQILNIATNQNISLSILSRAIGWPSDKLSKFITSKENNIDVNTYLALCNVLDISSTTLTDDKIEIDNSTNTIKTTKTKKEKIKTIPFDTTAFKELCILKKVSKSSLSKKVLNKHDNYLYDKCKLGRLPEEEYKKLLNYFKIKNFRKELTRLKTEVAINSFKLYKHILSDYKTLLNFSIVIDIEESKLEKILENGKTTCYILEKMCDNLNINKNDVIESKQNIIDIINNVSNNNQTVENNVELSKEQLVDFVIKLDSIRNDLTRQCLEIDKIKMSISSLIN